MDVIHALVQAVLDFYHAHQFTGLFLLVFIEEAGIPIPIPGDALVTIAGLERRGTLYAAEVIGLASAAVFLGSSILFLATRRGGRPLIRRFGKYVLLHEDRLARMERWFAARGRLAIIFGRLIPGLRIPTTVMAGLSGISYPEYAATAAVAAVVWASFFFFLGALVEHEFRFVLAFLAGLLDLLSDSVVTVWVVIGLLVLATGTLHIVVQRRRERRRFLSVLHTRHRTHPPIATSTSDPAPEPEADRAPTGEAPIAGQDEQARPRPTP